MKNKISLVVHNQINNKIFDSNDTSVNRDNCMSSFHSLKEELFENGFDLSTSDINKESESVLSLYFDLSTPPSLQSSINYLILQESEVINPFGWNKKLHDVFDRIYTWNDELVDDVRYFKLNFSHHFPLQAQWDSSLSDWNDKKLCTLISGNKRVNHPLELYSERIRAIKWFEANTPRDDFDFYGVGWNVPQYANKYVNYLLKKMTGIHFLFPKHSRYSGPVQSKNETLRGYKFAICFENAKEIPGYITEKIFDCFFAGCVPIYFGAPNISTHIPSSCYIDYREFDSYEILYSYLSNMSQHEYEGYIHAIKDFIFNISSLEYRTENFSAVLVGHILDDVKNKS